MNSGLWRSKIKKIVNCQLSIVNCRSGFTLIELLIAVAIIGVLASVLFANFIGVRQRARDSQRKSDLRQIQAALEFYRSDQGSYPDSSSFKTIFYSTHCPPTSPAVYNATTYMSKPPCDPNKSVYDVSSGDAMTYGDYIYSYSSGSYTLTACIENQNDSDPNISGTAFCVSPNRQYVLKNP